MKNLKFASIYPILFLLLMIFSCKSTNAMDEIPCDIKNHQEEEISNAILIDGFENGNLFFADDENMLDSAVECEATDSWQTEGEFSLELNFLPIPKNGTATYILKHPEFSDWKNIKAIAADFNNPSAEKIKVQFELQIFDSDESIKSAPNILYFENNLNLVFDFPKIEEKISGLKIVIFDKTRPNLIYVDNIRAVY